MSEQLLGTLQGPLLLFGGSYSNWHATLAFQRRAEQLGIAPSNVICTGDTVAYCAQPNETLDLLRAWGIAVLMGNCEESLATDAADCGCGFEAGTACDLLADSWYRYSAKTVSSHHKGWMANLPRLLRFNYENKTFVVAHGGLQRINQFVFHSTQAEKKLEQIGLAGVDGVVAGHCGLPFTQVLDGKLWHNPGALGMPANDATADVWYSLWRPESGRIRISHHRLDYDARAASAAMQQAGLDNGYAQALLNGLWPSMDVLPVPERQQRGVKIAESEMLF